MKLSIVSILLVAVVGQVSAVPAAVGREAAPVHLERGEAATWPAPPTTATEKSSPKPPKPAPAPPAAPPSTGGEGAPVPEPPSECVQLLYGCELNYECCSGLCLSGVCL